VKVTFDSGDLRYAFELASKVAPTSKGPAWDQAAGMMITVEPNGQTEVVATDLDTACRIRIAATQCDNEEIVQWRVSSLFLANFLSKLTEPITLSQKSDQHKSVTITSGTSKVRVPLIRSMTYPAIARPLHAPTGDLTRLASVAERVLWACDTNGSGALTGLHIDGEWAVGCTREGAAFVKVETDVVQPVTFAAKQVMSIVKSSDEVGMTADANNIFIWLDQTDWLSARVIAEKYPDVHKVIRRTNFAGTVEVQREPLFNALDRLALVTNLDTSGLGKVSVTFDDELVSLKALVPDVGEIDEFVDLVDGPSEPWSDSFTVTRLLDAVSHSKGQVLSLSYGVEGKPGEHQSLKITDSGEDWEAYIMPRADSAISKGASS
jgi:DNA polymerase III sliding clamp (beta) subunit (PCNA family)